MVEELDLNNHLSDDADRISELFGQLSSRKQLDLESILDPRNSLTLAVIRNDGEIIGMASMCTYQVISGFKGWIEDVVVDNRYRGKGYGKLLIEYLIRKGKKKGLSEILLFTEESKEAAIGLYSGLGFMEKHSRLYFLKP
jgi:phosphinothricin acetyltransferase